MNRTYGLFTLALVAGCAGGITPGEANNLLATPTKKAPGNFALLGVTTDNFAVVTDAKAQKTYAVNLASGAQQIITTGTIVPGYQSVGGTTVLVSHDANAAGTGAQLTAWSAATGAKLLSANATTDTWMGMRLSSDGQHIAFWDHVDAATDALTVDTPAHTAPQVLVKVSSACKGLIRFVPGTALRVAASYCTLPATAGGASDHVVTAFNLTSNTSVALAPSGSAIGFQIDPTGTRAMVRTGGNGAVSLVSLDGLQRSPVDGSIINAAFFNDGVELAYATADGALKRICNTGIPDVVVPSGVGGLWWMTPDSSAILYYTHIDPTSSNSDLLVQSTVAAGPPVVLEADGSGHPESFSGDSKHALFYQGVDATGHVGTFTTMPTAGGAGRVLSTGQSVVDGDWELPGTKIVYNDQWVAATATVPEHVALEVVDVAGTAAPTQLVASADPYFWVTADHATLVFTSSDPTTPGLYTVPIP
jgi:hypothetical protein